MQSTEEYKKCIHLGENQECDIQACGWNYCFVEKEEDPEMFCYEYEGEE